MSMKQVMYIHGGSSFSSHQQFLATLMTWTPRDLPGQERKKWSQTLRSDLGAGYEVFLPQMPNAQNAKYEEWKIWFERHFEYLHDEVILIGCSLGAMFLAKYFSEEKTPFSVRGLVLMAPAVRSDELDGEDCASFIVDLNKTAQIADKVDQVVVMHSKDDHVVPYEHGVKLCATIPRAEFVSFENKNHFLVPELPELLELIRKMG